MAKFKLPGFRQWLETVSEETARAGAEQIVTDLKQAGPYWSGHFEEQWVVLPGDKKVPADSEHPLSARESWQGWEDLHCPYNAEPPCRHPTRPHPIHHRQQGHLPRHRDGSDPGRYAVDKNNTADQDWYVHMPKAAK